MPATTLLLTVMSAALVLAEPSTPPQTATARQELVAFTVAASHSMDG
ncbi:hypothetical protein ACIPSA_48460 [Streptomyces sp. NPDC086549]